MEVGNPAATGPLTRGNSAIEAGTVGAGLSRPGRAPARAEVAAMSRRGRPRALTGATGSPVRICSLRGVR